jgi:hypothetical protein
MVDVRVRASALRAAPSGLHPFPPLRRPVTWVFCRMARSRFPPPASFQCSGLQRNSFRLLCRLLTSPSRSRSLRPAQSGLPDTPEISRGKFDRLPCTPAGLPPQPLMTVDFAIIGSLVRLGRPLYPVLVHRAAGLLHASFRPHLAMTPLRFTNPSPPSGWVKDFHLQAVEHARHTKGRAGMIPAPLPTIAISGERRRSRQPNQRIELRNR